MSFEFTTGNGQYLNFRPGLPPGYSGPLLRGAACRWIQSPFAEWVLQELHNEQYSLCLSIGKFLDKLKISGKIQTTGLYACFMLKSDVRKEVNTLGKLHVREDQYTCFFTDPTHCTIRVEGKKSYQALSLFYSPQLVEELRPFFPELETVVASPSSLLSGKACWTLPSMKEITNQLLNCPYDEATSRFYFDLKVRELLYQILENTFRRKGKVHSFTPWEVSRIHEARRILQSFVSKKTPTVRTLSKQVALNEFKLKAGFRQYFNTGIFEWLMEQKMQQAKSLLLTTNKPIKEICALVGYPRTTNFITAFRRRFGMTPGSLRRQ